MTRTNLISLVALTFALAFEASPAAAQGHSTAVQATDTVVVAASDRAKPSDAALSTDGHLIGHLLDGGGKALDAMTVELLRDGQTVGTTTTNRDGSFGFAAVRPGTYTLKTIAGLQSVRVWDPSIAPPSAKRPLALVVRETEVRGQYGMFADPVPAVGLGVGIAGLVLGAVAVGQNNDLEEDLHRQNRELSEQIRELSEQVSNAQ